MNDNQSFLGSAIEEQGLEPSEMEQTITVTTLFELLQVAELSPAKELPKALECNQARFQFFMLKELYRTAAFYYRQTKKRNPGAEDRLNRALKALANSLRITSAEIVERFLDAMQDEGESFWVILSSLSDFPAGDGYGFENRLARHLQQAVLLDDGFKTALQRSKAKSL